MSVVIDTEIGQLAERRQKIWQGLIPGEKGEVERISARLAELFAARRSVDAPTAAERVKIVQRARVESELERLIDKA